MDKTCKRILKNPSLLSQFLQDTSIKQNYKISVLKKLLPRFLKEGVDISYQIIYSIQEYCPGLFLPAYSDSFNEFSDYSSLLYYFINHKDLYNAFVNARLSTIRKFYISRYPKDIVKIRYVVNFGG